MDVYLLDWGYPDIDDKHITMGDYVTHYMHQCISFIRERDQQPQINLLGICQGGVLSLCYASLFQHIKNMVLISTPIDFHTHDNVIAKLVKNINIDSLTKLTGNVSGVLLAQFFVSLRPFELVGRKYLRLMDNLSNKAWLEKFLRVEKWINDSPDQAAGAFSEFIREFYQQNKFIRGEIALNGHKIKLENITIPY